MNTALKTALVLACSMTVIGPVWAGDATRLPTAVASYADLDISRPAGAKVLLVRIEQASATVCGAQPDGRDLRAWAAYSACHSMAVENAIKDTHSALLAQIYGQPQLYAPAKSVALNN